MSNRTRLEELQKELSTLKDVPPSSETIKNFSIDFEKFKTRKILKGHLSKVSCLHWSSTPSNLVTGSQDGYLIVWDAVTTNRLHAIHLPSTATWVMTCAYSPSNSFVACGGLNNVCLVFNLATPELSSKPCRELVGHSAGITCCRFVTDRQMLTASGDSMCKLFDVETGKRIRDFVHDSDVLSLALMPSSDAPTTFVTGAYGGLARLWDIRSPSTPQVWDFDTDVNAVAFLRNGSGFAAGCEDSVSHVIDIRSSRQFMVYSSEQVADGVTALDFSASGRFLFAGYDSKHCHVWDTLLGMKIWVLEGHEGRVSAVQVNSDGSALATGSFDTFVKIWA